MPRQNNGPHANVASLREKALRARCHPYPALKKTACSGCGRVQPAWYDRKRRRARDLSCGDKRLHVEFISTIVQRMKGISSSVLLQEFAHLRKQFWGKHVSRFPIDG